MSKQGSKREQMRALLARRRQSSWSAAEFCRRHGIKPQKLSYWKRVLGAEGPAVRRRSKSAWSLVPGASGFAPVRLLGLSAESVADLELQLPGGERLVLRPGVSGELLREVLGALRERC